MNALMLLIGGNPLPNYVTARYLLEQGRPDSKYIPAPGRFFLVYSEKTRPFKERLVSCLGITGTRDVHLGSDELDFAHVKRRIAGVLEKENTLTTVHLNYTGGTKSMVLAAYEAVSERGYARIFSYLDPSNFKLVTSEEQMFPVQDDLRQHVCPSMEDIFSIHCLEEPSYRTAITSEFHELSQAPDFYDLLLSREFSSRLEEYEKIRLGGNTREKDKKRFFSNPPNAEEFLDLMKNTGFLIDENRHTAFEVYRLLSSSWLEQRVFSSLFVIGESLHVSGMVWNVEVGKGKGNFEIDVIAFRGYQPIVFSCTTSVGKGMIKQKAFEVNYRSVQLGGDHAKGVVVCLGKGTTCEEVRHDMKQFDAAGNFSIIGIEELGEEEKLVRSLRRILQD